MACFHRLSQVCEVDGRDGDIAARLGKHGAFDSQVSAICSCANFRDKHIYIYNAQTILAFKTCTIFGLHYYTHLDSSASYV